MPTSITILRFFPFWNPDGAHNDDFALFLNQLPPTSESSQTINTRTPPSLSLSLARARTHTLAAVNVIVVRLQRLHHRLKSTTRPSRLRLQRAPGEPSQRRPPSPFRPKKLHRCRRRSPKFRRRQPRFCCDYTYIYVLYRHRHNTFIRTHNQTKQKQILTVIPTTMLLT